MLLYITFVDFNVYFGSGLENKIKGQIEAMEPEFGKIYYTGWSYPIAYLMDEKRIVEEEVAVTRKDYIEVLIDWLQKYRVKKTYIRYSAASEWLIHLLRYQKEHQIRTVLEIATFPYDKEMEEGIEKIEDMCYREEINEYVGVITSYSSHKEIWKIACIGLVNGISIKNIPISTKEKETNKIVLIAVSSMHMWHGYERVLEGMYIYYKEGGNYEIKLKLIGTGPEEQRYKNLVAKYHLETHVEFLGLIKSSEKLDEQYNLSDLAIGSLGFYKMGLAEASPIKGAEYCAKGIPFVCGYYDMRFPKDWEFIMNVSNNSEPIDINGLILFYEEVTNKKDYKIMMRNYAINYLTWGSVMKPVIQYFIN